MRPAAHSIAPNFDQALQLYQQGRLMDAASVCSALLGADPRHAGPARLEAIRARLRSSRDERPLFKTERICRQLEAAFQTMWLRHERGEPPAAFAVPAA